MLPRVAYWILFFHILLLTSGHARAIRDVNANQEHFRKNLKEVIANKSVRLYYKILNELFKRPAPLPPGYPSPPGPAGPGLPGKAVQFENFVLDFIESSYIGLFTPHDVYFGKVMPIYFPIQDHSSSLLPFTIPQEIVDSSIIRPLSDLAKILKPRDQDLKNLPDDADKCEIQPDGGENKICVKDTESIIRFIKSVFKSDRAAFKILETKQPENYAAAVLQEYAVIEDPQEIEGEAKVFCHPMSDAFYCHFSFMTKVLKVSLATENGDRVEAMAVCHMNSDPDSILSRMLGVKPGSATPLCHFLPAGHFIWVQTPAVYKAF